MVSLYERSGGYEFASAEKNLLFNPKGRFQNTGYVRFLNGNKNSFYLDPSPYYHTPQKGIFVLNGCPTPEGGQVIGVTVNETDSVINVENSDPFYMPEKIEIKYVIDWKIISPNKFRGNKELNRDEFISYFEEPLSSNQDLTDFCYCVGLWTTSSPQTSSLEKGGLNTVILSQLNKKGKMAAFQQMTNFIPSEFKRAIFEYNYYNPNTISKNANILSKEINLAYRNNTQIPAHFPLAFDDIDLKDTEFYKENMEIKEPMTRAFMIDALLFQPAIPERLMPELEETIYYVVNEIDSKIEVTFNLDLGSVIPKIVTGISRLNFKDIITRQDIKNSAKFWVHIFENSSTGNTSNTRRYNSSTGNFDMTEQQESLYDEICLLNNSGIELRKETVFNKSKIKNPYVFEELLEALKNKGYIYFPRNDLIGLLKF